jgi:hypothetical protein
MTADMFPRMPKIATQRGRHRTRPGQRRRRPPVTSVEVCSASPAATPTRHARVVEPRPITPYRRLDGIARLIVDVFVAGAVAASVLLGVDLATPDRPAAAPQRVEWVAR